MLRETIHALGCAVTLTAAGCTSLPYEKPVIEAMAPTAQRFDGLRDLAPGRPLQVLVVHGMCTHDFNWVEAWVKAMGRAFGSPGVQKPSSPVGSIATARYDFTDNGRTVEVTFAVWSMATAAPKQRLAYDSKGKFPYERAKFNDAAKSELINDCFADPVIYSGSSAPGTIGQALRADMVGVVCGFLGGQWTAKACSGADATMDRAFITESLGSKMLFDGVGSLADPNTPEAAPLRKSLARTRAIYMLANQLPLLALAEARAGMTTSRVETSELGWFGPSPGRDLADAQQSGPALQIVAFTDPNDQFSYRLTHASIGEDPERVALFNVIVSNAPTYFGLAENPWPAHVGYWDNAVVPRLVLEGGEATPAKR